MVVAGDRDKGRSTRVYAFCSSAAGAGAGSGGVTLVVLNTAAAPVKVSIDPNELPGPAHSYMLTSYPGVPTSRSIFLNGHVMELANTQTGELPPLDPLVVPQGAEVEVPGGSYGFVVLPQAHAGACSAV
jgi:hypothetical protein